MTPTIDSASSTAAHQVRNPGIPPRLLENLGRKKIPALDFLRAISAFIVVIYHFGFVLFPSGSGVMVFFVISGFLITWLLLQEFETTGRVALGHFYFRRTFRIFPAFYAFWAVTVGGLILKRGHILWGQATATFFYLGDYYQALNHYPESGLSHAWSLGVEEQFYLLWPAMFVMLARNRRQLFRGTCWSILAVWIYRNLLYLAGAPEEYVYTAFDTRIDHLLVGCLLAVSLRYGYFGRGWTVVCSKPGYTLLTLGAFAGSITAGCILGPAYRNTIGFMVDPILVAILLGQLLASPARYVAWMDSRAFVYLGTISYSTYLYHKIVSGLVMKVGAGLPAAIVVPAGLAATYVVAILSYYLVEKPFLRLRVRIEQRGLFAPIAVRLAR